MLAQVRGVAVADLDDCHYGYHEQSEVKNALSRRAARIAAQLKVQVAILG